MNFIKAFKKFSDGIDKACIAAAVVMIGIMVIVTIAQIICREYFKALQWSEEVCRFLLVWATFIGASCVYKEGTHITITFLQDKFSPEKKKLIQIFVHIICLVAFVAVVYFGFKFALKQKQLAPSLRIPMKYMYFSVPLGFGLMSIHAVNEILQFIGQKGGNK
ncbi:MAG: TRAP transporter small permease [Firmicutes bacterium]|nr:TRAP transporter small permease [Bacillota bacterium]